MSWSTRFTAAFLLFSFFAQWSVSFHMRTERHWAGGFKGEVIFNVTADLSGWTMHLVFDEPVNTFFSWSGTSENISDFEFVLNSTKNVNDILTRGDTLVVNFIAHANGSDTPDVCVFIEELGNSDCNDSVIPMTSLLTSDIDDYADALGKSILFYDAQRSGKVPVGGHVTWLGDSGLDDCVVGGWYDGQGSVKSGFPMATAVTLMLWGLHKFKDGYAHAGQLDLMYNSIRWPLDYFLQAWDPFQQELVVQIGDTATRDTNRDEPDNTIGSRACLKVSPRDPGSDVAGQTAAALAAGAVVFRDKGGSVGSEYAKVLLDTAEDIYRFASNSLGLYTDSVIIGPTKYRSTGYSDELCLAAAWLHKATGRDTYLTDAKAHVTDSWAWALDWNSKTILCQIMLYEATGSDLYGQEVEAFLLGWLPGGHVTYTPCGLAWFSDEGPNGYTANAAFVALLAAEAGLSNATYREWAFQQIRYIMGDNSACFSYQIGHGHSYPLLSRSCSEWSNLCPAGSEHSLDSNPSQLLLGAVVGGPSQNDTYNDVTLPLGDSGVSILYNAGFQSALAGILQLQAGNMMPTVNSPCPCTLR
ncbi:uncharacterized protein [Littorina saxatilis]|uniref:uncharacterized protein n=1 Tax=Littorina saxatilis TaxID=31220 RepID=UPI0038B4AB0E